MSPTKLSAETLMGALLLWLPNRLVELLCDLFCCASAAGAAAIIRAKRQIVTFMLSSSVWISERHAPDTGPCAHGLRDTGVWSPSRCESGRRAWFRTALAR